MVDNFIKTEDIYNDLIETLKETVKMRFICFPFVLLKIDGLIKVSTFFSTYTESKKEKGFLNRPRKWIVMNIYDGSIEFINNCNDKDFTDVDYKTEFDFSYPEINFEFDNFDEIRRKIIDETEYNNIYHDYITSISTQLGPYSKFIYDLSGLQKTNVFEDSIEVIENNISSIYVNSINSEYSKASPSTSFVDFPKPEYQQLKESPVFNLNWTFKNGLRYVPEEIFNVSNSLVENNLVFVDSNSLKSNMPSDNSIDIINHTVLCENKIYGIDDVIKKIKESSLTKPTSEFPYVLKRKLLEFETESSCTNKSCNCLTCPINCAAVISYLKQTGNENAIRDDRNYYKENETDILQKLSNDCKLYNFEWTPYDKLRLVNPNLLDVAYKLYSKGYVKVLPNLNEDNSVQIVSFINPNYYQSKVELLDEVHKGVNYNNTPYMITTDNGRLVENDSILSDALIKVAAYLYYLHSIGQLDYELLIYNEMILMNKSTDITSVENIVKEIQGTNEKSLYCIVNEDNKQDVITQLIQMINSEKNCVLMAHIIK